MIKYKILTQKNLNKFKNPLIDLLDPEQKRPKEILKSLKNSNFLIIALDWEKVIWSNQIITDMYFCAVFINLLVDPNYRNKWIWAKIFQNSLKVILKQKIKNIELVADPWKTWLTDFYGKYGFEKWDKNWTYMKLNKDKLKEFNDF